MRVSSVTMYEQSVASMNRQQNDFLKVGQQIASGRRVVNPSDDPQDASRAVGVSQAKAITEQFADSRVSARNSLAQGESVLNSVSDAITSAKTLLVQASSDTLSDADRESVASELRGIYETVIGQANATDGNGRYLFGGYQDSSPPFVQDDAAGGIVYAGDGNDREQRIDASRKMPVSNNGDTIFRSVPSGATHVAEADGGNTGNVTFSKLQVVDADELVAGEAYTISFDDSTDPATYTIRDSGGTALTNHDGEDYTPGMAISFDGLRVNLDGEPGNGDEIRVGTADQMNTNLFRTFERALSVLENPATTDAEVAELKNSLSTSMRELDNSLDNVLTVRASMGARLNELDVVDSVGSNRMLNYEQTHSDLVDLDYSEAVSEYSLRQVGLQAAQKAFVDIKGMSLFDFL
ncbi:MAG: flagellar hook-associated protein FlgL [Pseudomonadota bacterium]